MARQNPISGLSLSDPNDIPEEIWKQVREDQYWEDYIRDEHACEQEVEVEREVAARIADMDRSPRTQVSLRYRSKVKQHILLALMENADMTGREVCQWLDQYWEVDLPYHKPFIKVFEDERPLLESLISKVRADLRRSRRPVL